MSRLAKKLITIPEKVGIEQHAGLVVIKGPLATLQHKLHDMVLIKVENNQLTVLRKDDSILAKAIQGTTFVIINNHIKGVTAGFVKKLQLYGVGYKARVKENHLQLSLGMSSSLGVEDKLFKVNVEYIIPKGIKIETPSVTEIVIYGADKQLVGQVAANIRSFREPEPYKGKGIRYFDEVIQLKEAKKASKK